MSRTFIWKSTVQHVPVWKPRENQFTAQVRHQERSLHVRSCGSLLLLNKCFHDVEVGQAAHKSKQEVDVPLRGKCACMISRVITLRGRKEEESQLVINSTEGGSSVSWVLLNVNSDAIICHLGISFSRSLLLLVHWRSSWLSILWLSEPYYVYIVMADIIWMTS